MIGPQRACERYELVAGAVALPHGLLWLEGARALVAADAHLGYEDVIGGALPLWSTAEIVATLARVANELDAHEIIFLGDVIHGSRMSEGAARTIDAALTRLRAQAAVRLIAGNHEGRTRGAAVLGETVESLERDGWLLVHGDEPAVHPRVIVGHLHPSLALGGGASAPAFLASPRLIVVPALTPYSQGLDVFSRACDRAVKAFNVAIADCTVVATAPQRVFPFGSIGTLREALRRPAGVRSRYQRNYLEGDR